MSKINISDTPSALPLIAGTAGGASSTILLYPLDLIKVRLQVYESSSTKTNNTRSRGSSTTMSHVVRGIIRHEGYSGLYNGLTPAVVGSAVSWGGYFFFYEAIKSKMVTLKKQNRNMALNDDESIEALKLGPMENFTAACLSGAILVGFTNPIWLIKTRMQLQLNLSHEQQVLAQIKDASKDAATAMNNTAKVGERIKPPYRNMIHAAQTIIKEEGFASLYKGAGAALMLVSHGGVQFVCYEFLKGHFGVYKKASRSSSSSSSNSSNSSNSSRNSSSNSSSNSVLHRLEDSIGYLTMGAVSKIIATTTTYPLQVIKSRLQQRSQRTELSATGEIEIVQRQYRGIMDSVKRIWVNEGIFGFFKGCLPNAIRVAPSAAITFVVYESVIDLMSNK